MSRRSGSCPGEHLSMSVVPYHRSFNKVGRACRESSGRSARGSRPGRAAAARAAPRNAASNRRPRCRAAGAPARRSRCAPGAGLVESEAGGLEVEAAVLKQPPDVRLGIAHQLLVPHMQHLAGQHLVPVVHEAQIAAVVAAQILQVVAEGLALGKMLLEGAEAGVHRVAADIDDRGVAAAWRGSGRRG